MTTISHGRPDQQTRQPLPDPTDRLRVDFARACARLTEARRHQQAKDTPAHRSAVLAGRVRIDAILDTYLELRRR